MLGENIDAHHTGLELSCLAIKNVRGLDPIYGNSDSAIEESHQMPGIGARSHWGGSETVCVETEGHHPRAWLFRQHLAVFLAHGDKELVNGYGRVNCQLQLCGRRGSCCRAPVIRDRVASRQGGREEDRKSKEMNTHEQPSEHVRRLEL